MILNIFIFSIIFGEKYTIIYDANHKGTCFENDLIKVGGDKTFLHRRIKDFLKNKDFKNVLDNKKSIASKEFVIYIKNNELNHIRIGISVSSKIGNSVVRHKIKRQINEMLKENIDVNLNNDIVIIVRNKYLSNEYVYNKKILEKLLSNLLKGD